MNDKFDYVSVDERYVNMVISVLKELGLSPQEAFVVLLGAARMLADENGVPRDVQIRQFLSVERVNVTENLQ
jgi:antitoxin component of RelBE/YafQ-DinJ toxin-antitoxin module